MDKLKIEALKNSILTTAYISCVVLFMNYASKIKIGKQNEFLGPVVLLSLFVFSASLTGFLIFGKPALLFLDGKKKEALKLLSYTLASFGTITILLIILLLLLVK